ncbi:MAG: hypothetical protein GX219_02845 [Tissierellia bacterium]|nr:hypothetical protein [Tissierellia bacterium]
MKLVIDDLEMDFKTGRELLKKLSEKADEDERVFSSVIIDGEEYYQDFENVIEFDNPERVEMVFIPVADYVRESLLGVHDYIDSNKENIDSMVSSMYVNFDTKVSEDFIDFTTGIEWIMTVMRVIDENENLLSHIPDRETWNLAVKEEKEIFEMLGELNDAFESRDHVLIADLVKYEIHDRLDSIKDYIYAILSR